MFMSHYATEVCKCPTLCPGIHGRSGRNVGGPTYFRHHLIRIGLTTLNRGAADYGTGELTADSDVDVLIKVTNPSLFVLSEITILLESVLKRKVDLVSEKI